MLSLHSRAQNGMIWRSGREGLLVCTLEKCRLPMSGIGTELLASRRLPIRPGATLLLMAKLGLSENTSGVSTVKLLARGWQRKLRPYPPQPLRRSASCSRFSCYCQEGTTFALGRDASMAYHCIAGVPVFIEKQSSPFQAPPVCVASFRGVAALRADPSKSPSLPGHICV